MRTLVELPRPLEPGTDGDEALRRWLARFVDLYEQYGPVHPSVDRGRDRQRTSSVASAPTCWTEFSRALFERIQRSAASDLDPLIASHRAGRDDRALQLLRARRARSTSTRDDDARHARLGDARRRCSAPDSLVARAVGRDGIAARRAGLCSSPTSETGPQYATSPLLEHHDVVGDRRARGARAARRCSERGAGVPDRLERAVHLVDDDRREPERELVGDQQTGAARTSTRASDEHALLAARQRARDAACGARRAAGTARTPRRAPRARRLAARSGGTSARGSPRPSALRTPNAPRGVDDAEPREANGRAAGDVLAVEQHRAARSAR